MSFKVTHFRTNGNTKVVRQFLLVNNTNLRRILHRFQVIDHLQSSVVYNVGRVCNACMSAMSIRQ